MKTKTPLSLRRIVAGLRGFLTSKRYQDTRHKNCHPERRLSQSYRERRSRRTCGFLLECIVLQSALALFIAPLSAQNTGPQQLVFTGLLGSTNTNPNAQFSAQFNAVQSDASGNLYLLLDQKDGSVSSRQTPPRQTSSRRLSSAPQATSASP